MQKNKTVTERRKNAILFRKFLEKEVKKKLYICIYFVFFCLHTVNQNQNQNQKQEKKKKKEGF